jgi:hypothetical protein
MQFLLVESLFLCQFWKHVKKICLIEILRQIVENIRKKKIKITFSPYV